MNTGLDFDLMDLNFILGVVMNWHKYTIDDWLQQFGANSAIEAIKAYLELRDMT